MKKLIIAAMILAAVTSCSKKEPGSNALVDPEKAKPVADFEYEIDNKNGSIRFTNKSEGAIAYRWEFGDGFGSSSLEVNPMFGYMEQGDYEVSLRASNGYSRPGTYEVTLLARLGESSKSVTQEIDVDVPEGMSFADMTVDGQPDDWAEIPDVAGNWGTEIPSGEILTGENLTWGTAITGVKAIYTADDLYVLVEANRSLDELYQYSNYVDLDNDTSTGFHNAGIDGNMYEWVVPEAMGIDLRFMGKGGGVHFVGKDAQSGNPYSTWKANDGIIPEPAFGEKDGKYYCEYRFPVKNLIAETAEVTGVSLSKSDAVKFVTVFKLGDPDWCPIGTAEKPSTVFMYPYSAQDIANAGKGTDWMKEISRTGIMTNHNLSVNGGTETTKYLASIGYMKQNGIIKNNDAERFTARINLDQQIGKYVKAGITMNVARNSFDNVPLGNETDQDKGIYSYVSDGLLQAGEPAPAHQPELLPGQIKLVDQNNDGKLDDNDTVFLGTSDPDLSFGFNNTFRYRNFDLNIYFYGLIGATSYGSYYDTWAYDGGNLQHYGALPVSFWDTWRHDNQDAAYPAPWGHTVYYDGDYFMKKMTWFRCRNITLGYTVPIRKNILDRLRNQPPYDFRIRPRPPRQGQDDQTFGRMRKGRDESHSMRCQDTLPDPCRCR